MKGQLVQRKSKYNSVIAEESIKYQIFLQIKRTGEL